MLHHIGLTISDASDVSQFYTELLKMEPLDDFELSDSLSDRIFGINRSSMVYNVGRDGLVLELFVTEKPQPAGYHHLCLTVDDRSDLIHRARQLGYPCIVIEREGSDLVFLQDRSGNRFEIKENET